MIRLRSIARLPGARGSVIVPCVRLASIVGVLVLAGVPAWAQAQPTLLVRAETRLELDVTRETDGLSVTGALRDDLGVALGGNEVTLELSHAVASTGQRGVRVSTHVVTAMPDGTFSTYFPVEPGDYLVEATYRGEVAHRGTRATRFFDLNRAHLTLQLALDEGARIDLRQPEHTLTITASSAAGGAGLLMIVSDGSGSTELGRGTTDDRGVLRVTFPSSALGPPAAGRIVVRTHGDATRAEAQIELPVVRYRPTQTSLVLSRADFSPGDALVASGTLDDGVSPIPRAAISIVSGETVLATVLTDEAGRFEAPLDEAAFVDLVGTIALVARFDGAAPWIPGSESAPISLTLRRPLALDWLWAAVPIFLAALVVRWSLTRERREQPVVRRPDGASGVALGARRTLVAQRLEVSGAVRDAASGEAVADVIVRAGAVETRTSESGAFGLTATRDASVLRLEHPEYVPLEIPLALPHRGEHEAMQVRLASRRAVSFAALREVAARLAPEGEVALALTQREIFELLRSRGASPPALPELVARVEVACYAAVPPADDEIAEIRSSARAILSRPARERTSVPSATRR